MPNNKVGPVPNPKPIPDNGGTVSNSTTSESVEPSKPEATTIPNPNESNNVDSSIQKSVSNPEVGSSSTAASAVGRRSSLKPSVSSPNNTVTFQRKKRVSFPFPEQQDLRKSIPDDSNLEKQSEESENQTLEPDSSNNNNNLDPASGASGPVISKQPSTSDTESSSSSEDPAILLKSLENVKSLLFKHCNEPVPEQAAYSDESVKFDVFDESGTRLYIAAEINKSCPICFFRTERPFTFLILSPEGETVFIVQRRCSCCCCSGSLLCGDMCGQLVKAELPGGTLLGEVAQHCGCFQPTYAIKNAHGKNIFQIRGPWWGFCLCVRICCTTEFRLLSYEPLRSTKKRVQLGRVSTDWNTLTADNFKEGFIFGVSFPADLDVRLKATLLGAAILISFLHFENDPCGPSQFCF